MLALLALPALARAVEPLPQDKRLPAQVVATLSVPVAAPSTAAGASKTPPQPPAAATQPAPPRPLHMPTDVAVDSRGRVFVADGANDRIVRFAADGRPDALIAAVGQEKLKRPVGLTIDPADRLWIADTGNHRLLVAAPDGRLVQTIALPGGADGHAADPTDVVVSADGKRLYVVDNDGHRLLVRDSAAGAPGQGAWLTLGRHGRGLGQFQWPFMACLGGDGYLYVTEAIGARVQRVSPRDQWAGQIGAWGVELGELYRPKGIAADKAGRVFVGDSTLGVVQAFEPRGGVIGVLTDTAGRPLRFEHPMGMCFDAAGRLLVVELAANRVAVVRLDSGGTPAPPPAAAQEAPR